MRTSNFVEGSRPEDLFFQTSPFDPAIVPPGHFVSQQAEFRFVVRVTLAGKQRCIYGIPDFELACRFADMMVLRFKKYLSPDSIKWNFSEQQAIADTADQSERGGHLANFLLARLERELPKNLEPRTTHSKQERKDNQHRTNINRLDVLEACHANLEQKVAQLSQQIATLIERINQQLP